MTRLLRELFLRAGSLGVFAFGSTCAFAQGFSVEVVATPKVQGLHYNSSRTVGGAPKPGTQEATFDLKVVDYNTPQGAVLLYSWYPIFDPADPLNVHDLVIETQTYSSKARGLAFQAGIYTAHCDVQVWIAGTLVGEFDAQGPAVAIGGPLALGVYGLGNLVQGTPTHDHYDIKQPWYLQNFGYSPASPPFSNQTQEPQKGVVTSLTQPSGVSYNWEFDPPTAIVVMTYNGSSLQSSTVVKIGALVGTGYGGIRPRVRYRLDYGGTIFEYYDDSDETPPPGESAANPDYYRFTGHMPQTTAISGPPTNAHNLPPAAPPYYCHDTYHMVLKDNLGWGMPMVWVQERFNYTPPGLGTNCNMGYFWTTSGGGGSPLPAQGMFEDHIWCPDALSLVDYLSYVNLDPSYYGPLVHKYYAGSKSCSSGGVLVVVCPPESSPLVKSHF